MHPDEVSPLTRDEPERLLASQREALADGVAAQQRFRDLVNSVEGIVWEAEFPAFRFTFVSDQAERILGYPTATWISEPHFWADHLHPDDRGWAVDLCQSCVAEQKDHVFEYRMLASDGHVVWVRDLVTVVTEGGRATHLRGVMVDITGRKRAEEERQAHFSFFESMDRINRAIQGTHDLERMMSDVLDEVLSIFDCDRAWLVYPCDPDATSWTVPMEHTRPEFPGAFALGREIAMDPDVASAFRAVTASPGPVRFGPGSDRSLPAEMARRFGIQTQISMAIHPKADQPYLFGLHQCSYARVWTSQEERLFQEIGRRLTDALTSLLMFRHLRQSEAMLEDAQRIAHVGHWARDLETDRLTWSDETYRIFGLVPRAEPIDFARLQQLVHADDREAMIRASTAAEDGGPPRYHVEYRVVRPSGEVRTVHSQGHVTKDEAGHRRIFGVIQDITERKRAEYLTAQVFDSVPDRVAIIGTDYRYRMVNPATERNWRMPGAAIVGRHVQELFGAELFEERIKPRLDRCFSGEDVSYTDWLSEPDRRRYLAVSYSPLRPELDRIDAALVIARDLTDHILASEALQQAHASLAHFSRVTTMGELTASLAHEINQPIAAAITNANACMRWLARPEPDLGEARQAATRMVAEGKRAADIVSRIRRLFKKGAPQRERVDVNEVAREMILLLRGEASRYSISIRADLTAGLPSVSADKVLLQQVFMNLMVNGIDAMKDGNAVGEITVRSRRGADKEVLVAVTDTGVGLPAETDQIFSAFFTTKANGIGMGLPISRTIIESHGGRLWATSNADRGATFHFILPGS